MSASAFRDVTRVRRVGLDEAEASERRALRVPNHTPPDARSSDAAAPSIDQSERISTSTVATSSTMFIGGAVPP